MKILITGDFCPIGRQAAMLEEKPEFLLGGFQEIIESSDLAITNLECPITNESNAIVKTGPALKSDNSAVSFLKKVGFNLVTLANNHIMDYGVNGLKDSLEALGKEQMDYVGAGMNFEEASKFYIHESGGIKVAILNFAENEWSTTFDADPGANPVAPVRNYKQIQDAKKQADKVVVITHGGHEMNRFPSLRMKELYRFYVDAGADAVVNHHTHCTSGYEMYNNAPIFYSLGNFLFDHAVHRNDIWNKGMAVILSVLGGAISFEIVHYNQANENPGLEIADETESKLRNHELEKITEIIKDDLLLEKEFTKWVQKQRKLFKAFIEPHGIKLLATLQTRKLLPSLWSGRKKKLLLNLIRCEAHQDILKAILKDEISQS